MSESTSNVTSAKQQADEVIAALSILPAGFVVTPGSMLDTMGQLDKTADGISDIPAKLTGTDAQNADAALTELLALSAAADVLKAIAAKFGSKRDSNLCSRVAMMLKAPAIVGEGGKWASAEDLYKALHWEKSGAIYMASWNYKALLERQATHDKAGAALGVVAVPVASNPNHRDSGITIAQRIFCWAGQQGMTNWKQAEKKLPDLNMQAILLQGSEEGMTLVCGNKEWRLDGIGYRHPTILVDNTAKVVEYAAAIKARDEEAARILLLANETDEQKAARITAEKIAKAEADKAAADEANKAALKKNADDLKAAQDAAAKDAQVNRALVDTVLAKTQITSELDVKVLKQALTDSVKHVGEAYAAYMTAQRDMLRIAAALPKGHFAGMEGLRAICEDAKKVYGVELYAGLKSANDKAHPAK